MKGSLRFVLDILLALVFLPIHFVAALSVRIRRAVKPPVKPRIVWGPVPIGGTQYYSRACRSVGYTSDTVMYGQYHISGAADFDHTPDSLFRPLRRMPGFWTLSRHLTFLWTLGRYEVHFHNFVGGFLKDTLLVRLEIPLWHLAGGKKVVYPYGGDVQMISRVPSLLVKDALIRDYPRLVDLEKRIARNVVYYAKHADFVYGTLLAVDYLPKWDHLVMQLSAVDTDHLDPSRFRPGPLRAQHGTKTIVFHAPNHRDLKGTDLLIRACEELKVEGRDDFELVIMEARPNEEILAAMHDADIVADQFILGGYALLALEAMSLKKPVLCYIRPDIRTLYARRSWARELPIIDTHPDDIKGPLRRLLDHPEERRRLGEAGRAFVQRYHSLEAMGAVYAGIIERVYPGTSSNR